MTLRRALSSLTIVGIALLYYDAGSIYLSYRTHEAAYVSLSPIAVIAWPCFFIALIASLRDKSASIDGSLAAWWKSSMAFLIDAHSLFALIFIPIAALHLLLELQGFPPPWTVETFHPETPALVTYTSTFVGLVGLWSGLGIALHPSVTSPGAQFANIDLSTTPPVSMKRLALFGCFGYYSLFFPVFKYLASGVNPIAKTRSA